MNLDSSSSGSIGPARKVLRVLHGPGDRQRRSPAGSLGRPIEDAGGVGQAGSILAEVLISLSILGIAVIGVAAGSRAARLQAELASRRAAEALAAQQVLERQDMWTSDHSPVIDTVRIGVHDVKIRTEVRDSLPGLVWLRVQADAGAGRHSWQLESARRIP
ncbi:MAG: hypothetical protein M8840_06295 [marine benthic group bacterium]|jgi:hypothetical protein|nr:hypothetical protein [Gemmatimonadota bacterium]